MAEDIRDQYTGVLTWIILNTAISPADCYVYMKSSKRFVQFQKKQGLTRKNLIKKLMAEGIDAIFVRKEEEKHYTEFLERFLLTTFANRKISTFISQKRFHLLELPRGIQISGSLRNRIEESLPEGFYFEFLESQLEGDSLTTEEEDRESRILEILYDDIGLGSDAEGGGKDEAKHDEVIALMDQMSTLREENDQLRDRLKEIDEKEKEVRKAYDELYSIEGDKNELQKMVAELQRRVKISDAEIKGYKDGGQGADGRFKKDKEIMDRKISDLREEAKEFKLRYAREVEDTKKLKRDLHETTQRLNKTAVALKRVASK